MLFLKKLKKVLTFTLIFCFLSFELKVFANENEPNGWFQRLGRGAIDLVLHAGEGIQDLFTRQKRQLEDKKTEYEKKIVTLEQDYHDHKLYSQTYYENEKIRLNKLIDAIQKELDSIDLNSADAAKSFQQVITNAGNAAVEFAKEKAIAQDRHVDVKIEADAKAKATVESVQKGMQAFFDNFKDPKTSLAVVSIFGGVVGAYYGGKLGYRYIDSLMGKPDLIRESSRHDWKSNVKDFWKESILGQIEEAENLNEVILPQDMTEKLKFLADDAKNSQDNGLPYRHTLFYGLPGTGKTMFAKKLAKYSGMDYAIMSGADFSQFKNGEAITELHKLFDWAEHSKKGLLIFIDEADSFLRDRKILTNNEERNLLNAFLSRTGSGSDKYMLVFATNYENELDSAVLSRINKKIYFPLPGLDERIKIFNLYFDKYIINDSRIIDRDGEEVIAKIEIDPNIGEEYIKNIGIRTEGFSGRQLEQVVSELRVSAYGRGHGLLTKNLVEEVLNEKIAEHKHDMECAKFQKDRSDKALKS